MLSQAEQDVEALNDRLVDAKQAQERANFALKDKDERLSKLSRQLQASTQVQSGTVAMCCVLIFPCASRNTHDELVLCIETWLVHMDRLTDERRAPQRVTALHQNR